jgi:hypothetical protein
MVPHPKAYPSVLSRFEIKTGNACRRTALCAFCNRIQWLAKVIATLAKLSISASDKLQHCATVAAGGN